MAEKFRILTTGEAATCAVAQKIAGLFRQGDIIVLEGDLGAGKTYFVKGFTTGFRSQDEVSSPTFSIANFYRTGKTELLHIDLYRITSIDDWNDLGLSDYFGQSIVLIEWGMKFTDHFDEYLMITFGIQDENTRTLTFTAQGDRYQSMIPEIHKLLEGGELC